MCYLSDMDRKFIEEKAKEYLATYDFSGSFPPIKIFKLANAMGFVVGRASLPEGTEGIIAVDLSRQSLMNSGSNKVIAVDRSLDKSRQRFIVAHEIGHYILDNGMDQSIFARRETAHGRNEQENRADYFAACILMPEELFRAAINHQKAINPSINNFTLASMLSKQFDVPELSAYRRISEVQGIVDVPEVEPQDMADNSPCLAPEINKSIVEPQDVATRVPCPVAEGCGTPNVADAGRQICNEGRGVV